MNLAVMVYHANALDIYEHAWIDQCVQSMTLQTDTDFDVCEMNYAGGTEFFFSPSIRISQQLPTFVHAMNFLLDKLFADHEYDAVLNVNIDDYYASERVAKQRAALEAGYDIVSSNFMGIGVQGEVWLATAFDQLDVAAEIKRGHNVIAHGVVAYSKKFWAEGGRYVPEEIPFEDLLLWQREIDTHKFIVLPETLMTYRKHPRSVSSR